MKVASVAMAAFTTAKILAAGAAATFQAVTGNPLGLIALAAGAVATTAAAVAFANMGKEAEGAAIVRTSYSSSASVSRTEVRAAPWSIFTSILDQGAAPKWR